MFLARSAIQASPEMVQDLLPAAAERLADATAAFTSGSPTGTVYLAGFVVEMVLKHATLRTEGLGPHHSIKYALAPVRARLTHWIGDVPHESYHSMEFWALALRETFRNRKGRVPPLVSQAVRRAYFLHTGWMVDIRYRASFLQTSDAKDFLSRAGWFKTNANAIWR